MQLLRTNRWSLAFADLSLLMLGFVILSFVHPVPPPDNQSAANQSADNREISAPSENFKWAASALFEPREAMLTSAGKEKAKQVAGAIGVGPVRINLSITGRASASARLDEWELSAARMAAFARALRAMGADELTIAFGGQSEVMDSEPQRLIISITRPPHRIASANGTGLASK